MNRITQIAILIILLCAIKLAHSCPVNDSDTGPITPGFVQTPSRWYYPPASGGGVITDYMRFEWEGQPSQTFEVQYCTDLTLLDWKAVARATLPATAGSWIVSYDHPICPDIPARFFRIMVAPQGSIAQRPSFGNITWRPAP